MGLKTPKLHSRSGPPVFCEVKWLALSKKSDGFEESKFFFFCVVFENQLIFSAAATLAPLNIKIFIVGLTMRFKWSLIQSGGCVKKKGIKRFNATLEQQQHCIILYLVRWNVSVCKKSVYCPAVNCLLHIRRKTNAFYGNLPLMSALSKL